MVALNKRNVVWETKINVLKSSHTFFHILYNKDARGEKFKWLILFFYNISRRAHDILHHFIP